MAETDTNLFASLPALEKFKTGFTAELSCGDTTLVVSQDVFVELLESLKPTFGMLLDIVGMDYSKYSIPQPERFAVIYILSSLERKTRIRVKVFVNEDKCELPSIHKLYASANWFEREVFDLFGIIFRGHPNLIRILCHHEFEGHPLRKDYPSDQYQRLKTALPTTEM